MMNKQQKQNQKPELCYAVAVCRLPLVEMMD